MQTRRDFVAAGSLAVGAALLAGHTAGASPTKNRRIVLAKRPQGEPTPADFRLEEVPIPALKDGEILMQTVFLSLDPYMRGRMSEGPSYAASTGLNDVMIGGTVSRVIASRNPKFKEGDLVLSYSGWQEYQVSNGGGINKLDPRIPRPSYALGVLGMPGLTAYVGTLDIGQPKAGETLVGRGGDRRSRLGRRADREDQRAARGRHRGRQGKVRLRREGARLRRLHRSSRCEHADVAEGGVPEGHRRVLRERRRRGVGCCRAAAQHACAYPVVRPDRAVQRHEPAGRARIAARS